MQNKTLLLNLLRQVSVHGYISFGDFSSQSSSSTYLTNNSHIVAPFWTSDSAGDNCGGTVRVQKADSSTLDAIKSDINRLVMPTPSRFEPVEAVVATWIGVRSQSNYRQVRAEIFLWSGLHTWLKLKIIRHAFVVSGSSIEYSNSFQIGLHIIAGQLGNVYRCMQGSGPPTTCTLYQSCCS